MARKIKRSTSHRRTRRHYGGVAPMNHSDQGWSSKVSLGQGGDYLKYHEGQHGGLSLAGAPLGEDSALPSNLRAAAQLGGIDRAFSEISGMRDHAGGRRRSKRAKRSKSKRSKSKKSKRGGRRSKRVKKSKSSRRRRGGALSYSPYPSQGPLLSFAQQGRAGLSDQWSGVEVDAARNRAAF